MVQLEEEEERRRRCNNEVSKSRGQRERKVDVEELEGMWRKNRKWRRRKEKIERGAQ